MASQIDPLRSFIEESNRPYFVAMVKKEIKYLFSWLLQNDLQGGEILFEIQKARLTPQLFYFKQHLSTSEVILQLLQLPRVRKCMLYFLLKLSPAESRKSDIAWRWVIFQKYQMRRICVPQVHHRFCSASFERLKMQAPKFINRNISGTSGRARKTSLERIYITLLSSMKAINAHQVF